MIKFLLGSFLIFLSSFACGTPNIGDISTPIHETSVNVFDNSGDFLGEVWTSAENWKTCADDPTIEQCHPTHPDPIVCMEYSNDCIKPIICNLKVSALLTERDTGFTKKVTDVRNEKVFYNQTHYICFNFAKDAYNAWKLREVGEPEINCSEWTGDTITLE